MKRFETWLAEGGFVGHFVKNFVVCLAVLAPVSLLIVRFGHEDLFFRVILAVLLSLAFGLLRAWRNGRA